MCLCFLLRVAFSAAPVLGASVASTLPAVLPEAQKEHVRHLQ